MVYFGYKRIRWNLWDDLKLKFDGNANYSNLNMDLFLKNVKKCYVKKI